MPAHFVTDYEKLVADLKTIHPLDEAMSLAVGGGFDEVGPRIVRILKHAGLKAGMTVVDVGCGSGRVAKPLSEMLDVSYLGLDVVPDLLGYARSITPSTYRFTISHDLTIPADSSSVDFVFATSVFTHLLLEEIFLYMEEAHRVLNPGGTLVFSFLELGLSSHRKLFRKLAAQRRTNPAPHLNIFIERSQIGAFAEALGFDVVEYLDGDKPLAGDAPLGQSVAILRASRS